MVLSYRHEEYEVPLTSKCLIHTTGTIRDGDSVSVTSPVFASINYTSGAINASDQFSLPIRIDTPEGYIEANDEFYGILHCDDNDTFNMYITLR